MIITGSPTTPGLGRVFRVPGCPLPGQTPVPVGPDQGAIRIELGRSSALLATRYASRNRNRGQ